MNNAKHTSEPWEVATINQGCPDEHLEIWARTDKEHVVVACMSRGYFSADDGPEYYLSDEEAGKNGALCASAPELLGALKRLADASATVGNLDHAGVPVPADAWAELYNAHNAARGAIAKATCGEV